MTRRARWAAAVEPVKVTLNLPRRMVEEAKIRAIREERTLQEFVAEALEHHLARVDEHLDRIYKTGRGRWDELEEAARRRGQVFRGWKRGPGGKLVPVYEKKEGGSS